VTGRLVTRSRELKERAEARSKDARAGEEFARYQRSKADFERMLAALAEVDELARASREANIAELPLEEDRDWARDIASKIRDKLVDATGHEVERLANEAETAVNVLVANTKNRFDSELERWAERQPSPSEHVLDVLEPLAGESTARTRRAAANFQRLLSSRPSSASAIAQLSKAALELRDAYQEVASAAPEDVGEFLERAPSGIPLDEIDSHVLNWLRDNGAASSFQVRLRR
jgi:hypothetical protein